mgnify:CR=1 FL=1
MTDENLTKLLKECRDTLRYYQLASVDELTGSNSWLKALEVINKINEYLKEE